MHRPPPSPRPFGRIWWLVPALVLLGAPPLAPAPSLAEHAAVCGDGLLSSGETCELCPGDCQAKSCKANAKRRHRFVLEMAAPEWTQPIAVTAQVSYRSSVLSLPGTDGAASVQERIKPRLKADSLIVQDKDYALSIILARAEGLKSGPLLEIDFDTCQGGAAPTVEDLSCELVGCAGASGPVNGCTCRITAL